MKTIDGVDKPLKEWTASEIQRFCRTYNAKIKDGSCEDSCPLYKYICSEDWALYWNLSEEPKFTKQEIENAKILKRVFGDFILIKAPNGVISLIKVDRCGAVENMCCLRDESFPSILPGHKVDADEIIGDADA